MGNTQSKGRVINPPDYPVSMSDASKQLPLISDKSSVLLHQCTQNYNMITQNQNMADKENKKRLECMSKKTCSNI